jgi:hypothetical protein
MAVDFQIHSLNLDLNELKKDCRRIKNKVTKQYQDSQVPTNKKYQNTLAEQLDQAPESSRLHDLYNVFTFPYASIRELYVSLCDIFRYTNPYPHQYYVHAWLNYQNKGETIPWHYHWKGLSNLDETFVCSYYINAEPSVTTYDYPNSDYQFDHTTKNNTLSIYEDQGDKHMVHEWTQEDPRISISMDFVPIHYIQSTPYVLNTWMPVL